MTQIKIKDTDGNIIEAKLLYIDGDILHCEVEGMSTEYRVEQLTKESALRAMLDYIYKDYKISTGDYIRYEEIFLKK